MFNATANDNMVPGPQDGGPPVEAFDGLSESLFEILWRRRWTILLISILALLAGVFYLQRARPLYSSTSRLYVEQAGPQVWERDAGGMVTRWSNYLYTQAELIRQTEVLSAALSGLDMGGLETFDGVSNPVAALRRGLEVVVGKKDEIINVSFTSPDPDEAAHIVNTVVDAYITSHSERQRTTSAEVVRILREEKVKRDLELKEKLEAMVAFSQSNEGLAYGTDQSSNIIVRRLERFQEALDQAQLARIEAKSFYEAAKKMAGDPSGLRQLVEAQRAKGVYIASATEISTLKSELKRLQRDRADCLQRLKPDAPAIAALDAEIDRVGAQIIELDKDFATRQLGVAEEQYLAAVERERELEKSLEQQRAKAVSLNDQLSQYMLLQSDYEQTRRFCEILDDKIRKLNVDPQVGSLNIEIVEAAKPPTAPSEPQKARVMGLALCLGLFAGVGLALVREWRDERLRSTQEISALLGLPVLGAVPAMTWPKQTPSIRGQKVRISSDSREAEAFRTVRTAVFFGAPKDETRTILVTSPGPAEGKSTVASNLAIAMAQAGQKVMVVDADFRRPMQHKIFKLDRKAKGLSSILADEMSIDDAVEHSNTQNLDILTCGPTVSNPAEMINSESFRRIMAELADRYDRVIIDSPPIVAVTDSQILAALCDATVLVLRAEASTRKVSLQARESLAGVQARVLGVVVNAVPRKSGRYGYYGGYGYYYYGYSGNGGRKKRNTTERDVTEPIATADLRRPAVGPGKGDIDEVAGR